MAFGRVKWFNDAKGFGFIEDHEKQEIFVHFTAIQTEGYKTLQQGQEVEFDLYEGIQGPQARNVVRRDS